jgi:hypothetical protein
VPEFEPTRHDALLAAIGQLREAHDAADRLGGEHEQSPNGGPMTTTKGIGNEPRELPGRAAQRGSGVKLCDVARQTRLDE